jgi:hypothetical protein
MLSGSLRRQGPEPGRAELVGLRALVVLPDLRGGRPH